MLSDNLHAIISAAITFPISALILTLPYLIVQYRRYGSVNWVKVLVHYSFIFYCQCAIFLILLPLPDPDSLTGPGRYSLVPFKFFTEIYRTGVSITDIKTWPRLFISTFTLQFAFNVLLLVPLGIYLRYYTRIKKWWIVTLIGFGTSLMFELTQLTGDWFIYKFPYRSFDVDDLICNTLGCFLGFLLCKPLLKILPDLDTIADKQLLKAERVSLLRRAGAAAVDLILVNTLVLVISWAITKGNLSDPFKHVMSFFSALFPFAYYYLSTSLADGYTLGHWIFKIHVIPFDGWEKDHCTRAQFRLRLLARYAIVFWPIYVLGRLNYVFVNIYQMGTSSDVGNILNMAMMAFASLIVILAIIGSIRIHFTPRSDYLWGQISRTRLVNARKKKA